MTVASQLAQILSPNYFISTSFSGAGAFGGQVLRVRSVGNCVEPDVSAKPVANLSLLVPWWF